MLQGGYRIEKDETERNIKKTGWIIICISIAALFLAMLIYTLLAEVQKENVILYAIFQFIITVCLTCITIGGGTVLYSYFDFVNYIKKSLIDVIINNNFTDTLTNDKKAKIIRKLEKEIIYQKKMDDENTLYDFVNKEVISLVKIPYYESVDLNVDCYYEGEKLRKDIIRTIVWNTNNNEGFLPKLETITQTYFMSDEEEAKGTQGSEQQKIKPYTINKLFIQKEDYTNKIQYCEERTDNVTYNKKSYYKFKDVNFVSKEIELLEMVENYTTIVDKSDMTFSYRVYRPCKRFSVTFSFDNKEMEPSVSVFAFKDCNLDAVALDRERIKTVYNNKTISVRINDWILPGDGVLFIIMPKSNGIL